MRKNNKKAGFTLIELMIVVAIIGILAAIAIPNFIRYQLRSKTTEAKTVIGGIKTSIPFHQQILSSTQFMWGAFDTNFLEERFSMTYIEHPEMELSAAIAAALVAHTGEQRATVMHHGGRPAGSSWKRAGGWKR